MWKISKKITRILSAAFVLLMFLAIPGPALAASALDSDILIVGTEGTYPPFEYYDETNALTGFDMELVQAIGKILGREIRLVDMTFDGLIPALAAGKVHLVAAAVNATDERRQKVDFSDVYCVTDAALMVKADNEALKTFDDLKGKTVGVQLGTVEDAYLGTLGNSFEIRRYQKTDDAVREVVLGRNDGVFLDTVVALSYIDSDRFKGSLKIAVRRAINSPSEGFSLALRKGDPKFLEAVNGALQNLEKSGELQALKKKYRLE
ncbi:MAG: transporter substrate-binding domain-containing protein [Synergistaceae bacterium]|jgi:polar amino acid transport system substrate-binding protein|nr:transporter substrate-binding domain-containing protein [Synergistaceae bacterium]